AIDEQIANTRHAIAALIGRGPASTANLTPHLANTKPPPLPAAIPADLVGRRPDITAARWRVEATARDIDVAKAQFYPNVSLTAFVGLQSFGLSHWLQAGSAMWGVGPALSLPVFDAGRLRANLRGRTADYDEAVANYNATLIDAVREVADLIASIESIQRQQQAQQAAQAAAESAYDLAKLRYQAGLGNFLSVLTAENSVLTQRRAAVDLKARAADAQVQLMRALGGGFEAGNSAPPTSLAGAARVTSEKSASSNASDSARPGSVAGTAPLALRERAPLQVRR
ncbi:MAG TPA: efflux transporter outer membrane subunit, partial [Burkholderiales bacterium]|nr:efflux transporter outer membrane subunit [Burkholderiales bacterium]